MNQDFIDMAYEAGFDQWQTKVLFPECLVRFAELVAQSEREAIAQIIEDFPPLVEFATNDKGGCLVCGFTPKLAAKFIRARGSNAP